MGRFQYAGKGKNKKVTEILAWGPGNKISLKINIFSQKWAFKKAIFVLNS